jgi:creatinine amidohydrolase
MSVCTMPPAFTKRLGEHPVDSIPLGTLEWHGLHNVLGADALQADGIFTRATKRFGGIVYPPLYLGPEGNTLIGMDFTTMTKPHQRLEGSCYWVPHGLFLMMLESRPSEPDSSASYGHGPSPKAWAQMAGQ